MPSVTKTSVMVMAGTKDAALIIKKLKENGNFKVLATTTTQYGADIAKAAGADVVLSGKLDIDGLKDLIKKSNIEVLIDATHPFAASATRNAIKASETLEINYLRFERPNLKIEDSHLIHKVFSFEDAALKALQLTHGRVLHLAGVSTLDTVVKKIDPSKLWVRVLPSVDSVKKCHKLGLKQENIIAMQGTFSKYFNKALMEEFSISTIITKESGEIGGTSSKIEAALDLGLNIIIVMRPKVEEIQNKYIFTDLDEIIDFILKLDD